MRKRNIGLLGALGLAVGISGGCASLNDSKVYPNDYQGKPVFQQTGEMWAKTGKDLAKGHVHKVPFDLIGGVFSTVNDTIEMPIRGVTSNLGRIPYAGLPFKAIDYGLNTVLDSAPGGSDFNTSYGRLLNVTQGGIYERFIPGFFTKSYQGVYDRAKLEGKLNSVPFSQGLRIGIEGTIKTAIKTPIWLLAAGGGGGGGGAQGPSPGQPPPF